MSWVNFLKTISINEPGKVAIVDQNTGIRWSYRKLRLEVDRWTSFLQKNKVSKGDRVALLAKNRIEHISIFLASAQLGAIFVPLNWRLSDEELQEIVTKIDPKYLITEEENRFKTNHFKIDLNIWHLPSDYKYELVETSNKDPLLMLFTSGTTGEPKGVLFHGEMLESNQWGTIKEWGLKKDDVSIVETPFFHTGGYNVILLPLLLLGGTIILSKGFDPEETLELIEEEQVSVYFGVPTMFQRLSESKCFDKTDLSSIRFFISGGAPCPEQLINKFLKRNIGFRQGFGMTEVGPNCFSLPPEDAIRKLGSVGRPMKHTRTMVIKDDGEYAKVGEVGELLLAGPHVCVGYYNETKKYEESFYRKYFKTGDLVKVDSEGFFYIVGRKKEMYISGGENVYPAEIEKSLKRHPSIQEVAVVSVPSEKWGEVGYAFYRGSRDISLSEARTFLNSHLCRFKHPGHIARVEEFPLLGSQKINKKILQINAEQRV